MTTLEKPNGLTELEASARLKVNGYNELPRSELRSPLRIVLDVLREPMLLLLLAGGVIYLVLGDMKESIILMAFATISVTITVVQETRTERVLEALRDLTSPRAVVIRDGERKRIAGRDVVLVEGDRVPADARLIESHDLLADESLLTGESVPVRKQVSEVTVPNTTARPGGDDLPLVFSGSLIVRGSGVAEVIWTGVQSEIGKIGHSLSKLEVEPPRLQLQIRKLVRLFAVLGGTVSVAVVILYGVYRGNWLEAVLAGIALGMAMLPEEFPVVLTVFMAMGAWRIARANVLTRRASAIETLGSATVLCTDKTGTLTENRMMIQEMRVQNKNTYLSWVAGTGSMPVELAEMLEFGIMASAREPVDPMDKAFHTLGETRAAHRDLTANAKWKIVHAYGLRPDLLAVSNVLQREDGTGQSIIAAKGAPEAIARLCSLKPKQVASLREEIDDMAARGLRVLGVASASAKRNKWPDTPSGFAFRFHGLVGLADPLRQNVPAAMKECHSAGIRVIMITGDYPVTAAAIARQAGIDTQNVVTGDELQKMDHAELMQCTNSSNVFARIMPEQKLRIVEALKAGGEIVAMTGDGVNDAPSLRAAHIGVAMGGRGTDVAREASSIVLLDDDFSSIVKSIRLGRRIFDNLQKAICFIFAVHMPIAGLALLPIVLGYPIILAPVHIAFLEMVIDPVCSLVFEAETEEIDVMQRKPRSPDAPLFSFSLVVWSLVQGGLALALVALTAFTAIHQGMPENEVRALAFFSLVMIFIGLILVNRAFSASVLTALRRPNPALVVVLPIIIAILAATLTWPFASDLFRFGPLHANDLVFTLGVGIVVLVVLEFAKTMMHKFLPSEH
jgi:Ca2+-transporting ATPase